MSSSINKIAKAVTRTLSFLVLTASMATIARGDATASLAQALKAADAGDWTTALQAAQGAGPSGGDVILWQWLRDGQGKLGDYEAFLARHPDWPGLPLLKQKGEVAVARSTDPARVLAYFGTDKPGTGKGSVAMVQALMAQGRNQEAEAEAYRGWTTLKFDAADESAMLALQGEVLKLAHEVRLDRILWDGGRRAEAERMLPRVSKDWQALALARMALRSDSASAVKLTSAVPKSMLGDPGLAYERYTYRMRADRYDDAAKLILQVSDSKPALGDPAAWAGRRADLVRILFRQGKAKDAYRVAAGHQLTEAEGADYADLEFLAGFVALRELNDPALAVKHFKHLKTAVGTPISLARADYWMGRALEAAGDKAGATAAFARAAQYQTAYYGLLAAEHLGLSLDPALVNVGEPDAGWKTASFAQSSVLAAARALLDAGDLTLAKRFFLQVGETLSDKEMSDLGDLALRLDQPHVAVLVGKAAAERGLILPRAYFPVPDFVPDNLPVSRALALAISRRESEFDPNARSHADARGLMQLLPATAQMVAKQQGESFTASRLTTDPAFNVRMGSAFLAKLIGEHGPSIALIAAGYNAGPGRPRQWIERFGDPRDPKVDIVDWVETIPFGETRTYVMRVSEGVVIYRGRLKGASTPVRITSELTGR